MDFKNMDISPELREKAKACTTSEELFELAKKEGIKLSEDDLEAISGGLYLRTPKCTAIEGDVREDIDPELAHADFINGVVDGGELD